MTSNQVTDAQARRYLLGDIDEIGRERIESRFMMDSAAKMLILVAEEELIEAYLENDLADRDRAMFLVQYGARPNQRRKLRIARAIRGEANSHHGSKNRSEAVVLSRPSGWFSNLWKSPQHLRPIGATLVLLVLVGAALAWWLGARQLDGQRQKIEQELVKINQVGGEQIEPSRFVSLTLRPGSTRAPESRPKISLKGSNQILQLELIWTQKETYPQYQAVVRQIGTSEEFTISQLTPDRRATGFFIPLRLPGSLLTPGFYQITLHGVDSRGALNEPEGYVFTVHQ